jgi:hypothetical protein
VWYDPAAVSTLDITALFDDATLKPVSPYFEAHRPLNLAVRQVSYQWNQGDYTLYLADAPDRHGRFNLSGFQLLIGVTFG